MNHKIFTFVCLPTLALASFLAWVGQAQSAEVPTTAQRAFASAEEATNALFKAVTAHDHQAIREMFGPEITNLSTGDKELDERHLQSFATNLAERCQLAPDGNHKLTLEIGKESWPFPIPLIETNGAWMFDTIAGEDEIINRNIGRDEFYAIGVCRAYVKAQQDYSRRFAGAGGSPKYAERFKSTPGKRDGLYWPAESGGSASPFSTMVADASIEGYHWGHGKGTHPFHGYVFKILTRQGPDASGGKMNYIQHGDLTRGFALVAYPVRWGESGIMTFIVNQNGIVYQRCLGKDSTLRAATMKEYNPDGQWTAVQDAGITDLTADQPVKNGR